MNYEHVGCQWIGEDQDPRIHCPIHYCGGPVMVGRAYCEEHYPRVYVVGSARGGGRSAGGRGKKATVAMTFDEIMDLMNECIKELELEGVL